MVITGQMWIEAAVDALRDRSSMFEAEGLDVLSISEQLPEQTSGAFISIAGGQQSVQLGVLCGPAERQALAQKFLGDDTLLGQDDLADAMREIANIVAGGLKSAMLEYDPCLALGLPLFVEGVQPGSATRAHCARVILSDQALCLVVIVGTANTP